MTTKRKLSSSSCDSENDEGDILQCSDNELNLSPLGSVSEGSTFISDEPIALVDDDIEIWSEGNEQTAGQPSVSYQNSLLDTSGSDIVDEEMQFKDSCDSILDISQYLDNSYSTVTADTDKKESGTQSPFHLQKSVLVLDADITREEELFSDENWEYADSEFSLLDSEDGDDYHHILDPPIFKGADMSVNDSMIAILSFVTRHQLNGRAIADLLELINLHCGREEKAMKTSLYHFKKYFSYLKTPPIFHYYCSHCFVSLAGKDHGCPNSDSHPKSKEKSFFVELPLVPQLQALFSKESFAAKFNHRFKRAKTQPTNLEDIYDGQLYQEQIENGFLAEKNKNNYTLMMFSDGVPVFKSSGNKSLWPVYFCVNELPYHMRSSKEFMLIGGLWYGGKPAPNLILQTFTKSLGVLRQGVKVRLFGSPEETIVKGALLAGTFDLPAKAMFLGMMQFNGTFGCQICKMPGESVKVVSKKKASNPEGESKSSVWVYRYSKEINLRQHSETENFGEEAHALRLLANREGVNVFGVKYPSAMFKIMIDAIRGIGIDELHAIYLGVVNKLVSLWFDSKFSNETFSVRSYIKLVDSRLKQISPPNFVHRDIRSLENDFPHWKGNEKKVWLLYLSVPVLKDIMKDRYLEHHATLVTCVHTLLKPSISANELLLCGQMLDKYVQQFEILYGTQHMTMNVHLLLHLAFVVNNLGPMWCYSCFPFESLNGEILKMIHGTRYIETQVASSAFLIAQLPHAVKEIKCKDVQSYCSKLLHPSCRLRKLDVIADQIFSVGCYKELPSLPSHINCCLQSIGIQACNVQIFLMLLKDNLVFTSRKYGRSIKTTSYFVSFQHDGLLKYGVVDMFVKTLCKCSIPCQCKPSFLAIIEVGSAQPLVIGSTAIPHIHLFSLDSTFIAVDVKDLRSMLFCVTFGDLLYVCDPPNFIQHD